MIEQLQTIREFFLLPVPHSPQDTLEYGRAKVRAEIAVAQLKAMVGEPVARFVTDDGVGHVDLMAHQGAPLADGQLLFAAPVAQQPQAEPHKCCANCAEHGECRPNNIRGCGYDPEDACNKQPQAEAVPQDVGQLEYRGNSVAYIHQKMTAYRGAIDAAWQAMRDAGHPPDGCTPLAQAITKALAPQQAEAVPPGYVPVPVEPTVAMLYPVKEDPPGIVGEKGGA